MNNENLCKEFLDDSWIEIYVYIYIYKMWLNRIKMKNLTYVNWWRPNAKKKQLFCNACIYYWHDKVVITKERKKIDNNWP
jgi:hypothetical protein